MNKKEVLEIKKQFKPGLCAITKLAGCYVDGEKEKRMTLNGSFRALSEEDEAGYLERFRKTLSGTYGKNLVTLEYPTKTDIPQQKLLHDILKSKMKDNALLERLFDSIIETLFMEGSYYIMIAHCVYDIPGSSSDEMDALDSEEVYEYLLCSICPVALSKSKFAYSAKESKIKMLSGSMEVGMPSYGFLWPSFGGRTTNLYELLYYMKKPAEDQKDFVFSTLGTKDFLNAKKQQEAFQSLFPENIGVGSAVQIFSALEELKEEKKYKPEQEDRVGYDEMEKIFSSADVEVKEPFQGELMLPNIKTDLKIKTDRAEITSKDYDLDIRIVDGRPYILVPADGYLEVNDIEVEPEATN